MALSGINSGEFCMRILLTVAVVLASSFSALATTTPPVMKATAIVNTINYTLHHTCELQAQHNGGFVADITIPKPDTIVATFRAAPDKPVTFADTWLTELTPDLADGKHFGVAHADQSFWIVTENEKCEAFELIPPPDANRE